MLTGGEETASAVFGLQCVLSCLPFMLSWDCYQRAGEQKATQARGIGTAPGQRGFIPTFPAMGKGQFFALNHGYCR